MPRIINPNQLQRLKLLHLQNSEIFLLDTIRGFRISVFRYILYNGKELQDELEQYDYGARFYDPVIGRWNVIDPASEYYPEVTPYSYVMNDTISFVDDEGEIPGPTGFVLGALSDYIGQVGNNYFFKGKNTLSAVMTEDINYWSIGILAV